MWGERYIDRFCSLSLPSFISPGNLPSLADGADLEVVILTREADRSYFEMNLAFRQLRGICSVRFVAIDDLITNGVYGVTLTLAYARPIIACGEDMLNTHFVFMNADFVLADGSLRSLLRHIQDGRSIVLGPSYRAIAEMVEPTLEALVDDESAILNIAPRDLVRMSLPHPHRTTIAKSANQQVFSSTHPNQLFWQVDQNTVLGRYYLIFMLCLKPERVITNINCFCDYSFIPELCPSGDEVAMGDSDEFFMLELQNRTQETYLLRQGTLPYGKIAASLQQWTTAEHRRAASHDIVFHSEELPEQLAAARREADSMVASIGKLLGQPKSHVNHHYWVMGLETWKKLRREQGLTFHAPELAPYKLGLREHYLLEKHRLSRNVRRRARRLARNLRRQAREIAALPPVRGCARALERSLRALKTVQRLVIDGPSRSSPASSHWQMDQLLQELGLELRSKGSSTLLVGHPSIYGAIGEKPTGARAVRQFLLSAKVSAVRQYDQVVFFPDQLGEDYLEKHLGSLLASVTPGGSIHMVVDIVSRGQPYHYVVNLVFQLGESLGNRMKSLSIRTVGGRLLVLGDRLKGFAARQLLKFPARSRLLIAPLLAPVTLAGMALTYIANTRGFDGFGKKLTPRSYGTVISMDIEGVKPSPTKGL